MFSSKTIQRNRILYLLKKFNKFLIIGHIKPDGDSIGSMLGLHLTLKKLGKETILACDDNVPDKFNFLYNSSKIVALKQVIKLCNVVDAIIVLDCGGYYLSGLDNYTEKRNLPILINIDHHHDNPLYGDVNLVEGNKSSTAEIVYGIIQSLDISIDHNIATCILNGIFVDTDSFKNPNTSVDTLKITSKLLSYGANLKEITKNNLMDKKLSTLKLWGRTLSRIKMNEKLGIISTVVTKEDFKSCNAKYEDIEGIANFLNSIPDARASLVLSERNNNQIKGSLRTLHDDIDVSRLAALFGGGGHKKASGFTIPGKLISQNGNWHIQ